MMCFSLDYLLRQVVVLSKKMRYMVMSLRPAMPSGFIIVMPNPKDATDCDGFELALKKQPTTRTRMIAQLGRLEVPQPEAWNHRRRSEH